MHSQQGNQTDRDARGTIALAERQIWRAKLQAEGRESSGVNEDRRAEHHRYS